MFIHLLTSLNPYGILNPLISNQETVGVQYTMTDQHIP